VSGTAPAQGGPILLVEDDAALRRMVAWALEDEGLACVAAADGREALAWLAGARPALVLLDMGLPEVGGEGVAAGLRARHGAGPPIVVLTADGRAPEKARRVGAAAYLRKPFELDALLATVARLLPEP
jgi:two-component system KDP operon response regulator KdpE